MFNFQEELSRFKPCEEVDDPENGLSGDEVKDILDIVKMIAKGEKAEDAE